ncbi:MAG: reverse transcriptase domain-containing protein [Candidatus Thiodiazotropha endolucinida]|nr:hypothetical protein [Candidatus Thiodiazotropha taylori]MCW4344242.1 reverse transcriptase domain-containing protein [Candidatus Thiodiazotropha endolucinida]
MNDDNNLPIDTDSEPLTSKASNDHVIFDFKSKGLHVCNLNVRHILPKIDEIRLIFSCDDSPDIFGICESFLGTQHPDSLISIDGFNFHRKDRCETQHKTGGGLVLYFRQSLNIKRRYDLEISNIETLWVEICLSNCKPFLLCTTYRPPSACSEWIDLFENELSIANSTGLEFLLMGDFNIDLQSCSNRKWLDLIQLLDLTQLVKEPTRVTESSSSIIDHAYSSDLANITECFVPPYAISDHFPICFTRKVNQKIPKTKHIKSSHRCFNTFNETDFLYDLRFDLSNLQNNTDTIDNNFSELQATIVKLLDKHAPIKTRRVKSNRLPAWYTSEIGQARAARDKCKRLKLWTEYKHLRNKTRNLIRKAKRQYFSNSIENSKDTSAIWRHLRAVNKGSSTTDNVLPDKLTINGETYTDSETVAVKFNEFFTSIAEILSDKNTNTSVLNDSKLRSYINEKVPGDVQFRIPLITTDQVLSYIHFLDASKATGLDGIGPKIIKLAADILSPFIANLINKSICSGTFPSQLKCAKVFPVFKAGSKSDPSNYRPISILPTISKIFEKHVNKHLMNYLNKYQLIHESQSGFRRKHSCQTALTKLLDQWMSYIDRGNLVGSLFIDFRKAFDVVDHSILLNKLSLYKLNELSLQWFSSYLLNRKQAVANGQGHSDYIEIKSGVPQGSILGPTLFLLFINDLPLFTEYCFCDFYADDATLHTNGNNLAAIENNLLTDGNKVKNWGKENNMHIHYTKTTCMVTGTRQSLHDSLLLNITIDGHDIENVSQQKLLGLLIDNKLTWSAHIDNICSVVSSKISLLRQLAAYVSTDVLKKFYQGYILPIIDYGSITWAGTSATNLERILKLQKRAARIILHADFNTPSSTMFTELGWQPVHTRLKYNKAVFIYKALNGLTPEYITSLLKPVAETHDRHLRSSVNGNLAVPRSRTSLYDRSFAVTAPRLWNSLPISLRNSPSLGAFKTNLINAL